MAASGAAPLSFKTAAVQEAKDVSISTVQLAGSVVLKILQHCSESVHAGACGQLLGLDIGSNLEVTECFPFLESQGSDQLVLQKMRCLRDINVDTNTVGWYQSAPYNDYQTVQLIDTFISYNESVKKCVCIVCDAKDSARGGVAVKALRLDKKFLALYKKNPNLSARELFENEITWRDVFVEVPIKVQNSPLVTALMGELDQRRVMDSVTLARLRLNSQPHLEKQLEHMGEAIDSLYMEVQDMTKYVRQSARQEQLKAIWLQKRKEENLARKQNGEEPLPEDDPAQFKPLESPSLVNSFLLQQQLAGTCGNINAVSSELLHKLSVANCLRQ